MARGKGIGKLGMRESIFFEYMGMLATKSERNQYILMRRLRDHMSLSQIADEVGLTPERIRQIILYSRRKFVFAVIKALRDKPDPVVIDKVNKRVRARIWEKYQAMLVDNEEKGEKIWRSF